MNQTYFVDVVASLQKSEVTSKSLCDYMGRSSFHLSNMLKLVYPILHPALTNVDLCFDALSQCSKSILWCMETVVLTEPLLYNISITCTKALDLLQKVPALLHKSQSLYMYIVQMDECLLQLCSMTQNVNLAVWTLYCLGATAPKSDAVLHTFQWLHQQLQNGEQMMNMVVVLAESMVQVIVKALVAVENQFFIPICFETKLYVDCTVKQQ